MPRLVLQPLLENAVEHGINPVQKGTIIIRAYREQDRLLLEIENDGVTTYDDLMKIQGIFTDGDLRRGGNGQRFAGHPQRPRAGKDHLRAGERPFRHNH